MNVLPFESKQEHLTYCIAANVPFEDGAVGFKIFDEEEMLGLIQIKFVGEAAYFLSVKSIEDKILKETLANICLGVVEFLPQLGATSFVFPIQDGSDRFIAEHLGFDRISDTLYVFDCPNGEEEGPCDCGEHCHHKH